MKRIVTIIVVLLCVALLIAVRAFQEKLFYDPFLSYFEGAYLSGHIPDFSLSKLLLSLTFRFVLNALLSLAIIYLIFKSVSILKASIYIYILFFIVVTIAYILLIYYQLQYDYFLTFYVRRFLIQPLLLFILVPAFYYQKMIKR
ncbi:exosortase F system-associated membrane protein [Zhouia sp. PK063]|uniref:exosortase F system-associated membrane protein n=1 Tax=Zhouia sp. PK063 TaxID=3373602 RepID=UPI00379D327F